jgi:hypothetical protein
MDMVRQILEVMKREEGAVTIRHISHVTGSAPVTLVGIMMVMINQGYVTRVQESDLTRDEIISRCSCAYCSAGDDRKGTSLDRTVYRISRKGEGYLIHHSAICSSSQSCCPRDDT